MKFTNFIILWKKDPMFQSWLLEDPASKHNFKCKVCQSTLELGNMGKWAVVKHSKSILTSPSLKVDLVYIFMMDVVTLRKSRFFSGKSAMVGKV